MVLISKSSLSARAKRRLIRCGSIVTFAELEREPSQLLDAVDLYGLRVVGSYDALNRRIKKRVFPEPLRLPTVCGRGVMRWKAQDILDYVKAAEPSTHIDGVVGASDV